ncbi:uncharacterized protein LOC127847037 isoform X2 [Dreissena polymorpha]|nr:uncharacterized protein LOC127847037 isoform X2 [Dreissena polymorpha]XP_052234523.1 uncharacterized protein LOC127847037 isoform X2 [Dreissena polymorpha]
MLNCTHFQNCLSSSCISPPPPDKQCPLEMVRQIGRDVRHTSDCKITDADLQGYFQTLSTLLADPICLQHDHSAKTAHARLDHLQNDRMSLTELGEMLKGAYQTLENVKMAGECFSKEAEKTLRAGIKRIKSMKKIGEQRLKSTTKVGEQRLKTMTKVVEQRIESKRKDAEQKLESKIQDGTQRIESNVNDGIVRIQQSARKTASEDYERGVADLRQRLIQHYNDTTCNVPLLTLDQSLDKRITDMYAAPKIHQIKIEKDGKLVKNEKQVLTYKELFYTDNKLIQRIYIQGEPGRGKSTCAVKLVDDWCNSNQPSSGASIKHPAFEDRLTIQKFKLLFFITLRDSRDQTDVTQMIKKQLIDKMFFEDECADVYKLLVQILKTEICLVVREGLDEWVSPSDSNLAEPSMAGFSKDTCTVLTTSRPWKLADERIKNSQIDSLFEIEGISDPYAFAKNILRCIIHQKKDLQKTVDTFNLFVSRRKLQSLSSSPMLYALVICTWVDTIEDEAHLKGYSLCILYTTLLESLCKKANSATGYFNESTPPPVHCFYSSSYLQPNIEHLDKLAEVAFKLLFSSERESSIVFDDITLSNHFSNEEFTVRKMFALKAGILTNRNDKSRTGRSYSFVHKTVQEFLAAYHIACNPRVIDDVISRYLKLNTCLYLDIAQVLIFVCGMKICAANELSALMNQCHVVDVHPPRPYSPCDFQLIIESGIREAAANKQDDIHLQLSHFYITKSNVRDCNVIWSTNTSNVELLLVVTSSVFFGTMQSLVSSDEHPSHFEVNLSSCNKLKSLQLSGKHMWLIDTASPAASEHPVWIILDSTDPAQCADPPPVLPSIERILLDHVTCSSSWLRSLFRTLMALDHEVVCELKDCDIQSFAMHAVSRSYTDISAKLQTSNNTFNMQIYNHTRVTKRKNWEVVYDCPGLWESLRGRNIKSLTLSGRDQCLNVNHLESLSQSLSSLKQLNTLTIYVLRFINIRLPKSLKHLHIYCNGLSAIQLRKCVNILSACDQQIEVKLEFGCSFIKENKIEWNFEYDSSDMFCFQPIPVEKYMTILQELETAQNVAMKRFRIYDRIRSNMLTGDADSAWSVRGSVGHGVDNDNVDIENVQDKTYIKFIRYINNDIINRISMRFLMIPASNLSTRL